MKKPDTAPTDQPVARETIETAAPLADALSPESVIIGWAGFILLADWFRGVSEAFAPLAKALSIFPFVPTLLRAGNYTDHKGRRANPGTAAASFAIDRLADGREALFASLMVGRNDAALSDVIFGERGVVARLAVPQTTRKTPGKARRAFLASLPPIPPETWAKILATLPPAVAAGTVEKIETHGIIRVRYPAIRLMVMHSVPLPASKSGCVATVKILADAFSDGARFIPTDKPNRAEQYYAKAIAEELLARKEREKAAA